MSAEDQSGLAPSAREEIGYWEREFTLKGAHSDVAARRLDPAQRHLEFPPLLTDPIIPALRQFFGVDSALRCVEIGAGPMSTLAGDTFELAARDDLELVYLNYRSYLLDGWIDVVYRQV